MTTAEQAFIPGRADLCFHSLTLFHQFGPRPAHFVLITECLGETDVFRVNYFHNSKKIESANSTADIAKKHVAKASTHFQDLISVKRKPLKLCIVLRNYVSSLQMLVIKG